MIFHYRDGQLVYVSCSYDGANLHPSVPLSKQDVGGKSQSWLINTSAKPTWEVVTGMRRPVV